jgi:transcriptional regulator with XRE-family HTH domain
MTPQETFVTRLRRHRERQRVSIDDIAARTRVKREQLEAFENGDLSGWPRGIYARAWVRAYAGLVGLDEDDTVDEFCRLFPHGDRRAAPTVVEIAEAVAEPSMYADEFEKSDRPDRRRRATDIQPGAPGLKDQLTRMTKSIRSIRQPRPRPAASK